MPKKQVFKIECPEEILEHLLDNINIFAELNGYEVDSNFDTDVHGHKKIKFIDKYQDTE